MADLTETEKNNKLPLNKASGNEKQFKTISSDESHKRRREYHRADKRFKEKIDLIVVEHLDNEYRYDGDVIDPVTNQKVRGFADQEKLDDLRDTVEAVLKKRLERQRKKTADKIYFQLNQGQKNEKISRESLQFFEVMDEGQRLSDNIEFKFAQQFDDLNSMSTMVAMTAGVTAHDVGINKLDCASEVTRSLTSQQKLRQPALRLQLLNKYQRGKIDASLKNHRKTQTSWITKHQSDDLMSHSIDRLQQQKPSMMISSTNQRSLSIQEEDSEATFRNQPGEGKKSSMKQKQPQQVDCYLQSDIKPSTAAYTSQKKASETNNNTQEEMSISDYKDSINIDQPSKQSKKIVLDKRGRFLTFQSSHQLSSKKFKANNNIRGSGSGSKVQTAAFGQRRSTAAQPFRVGSYELQAHNSQQVNNENRHLMQSQEGQRNRKPIQEGSDGQNTAELTKRNPFTDSRRQSQEAEIEDDLPQSLMSSVEQIDMVNNNNWQINSTSIESIMQAGNFSMAPHSVTNYGTTPGGGSSMSLQQYLQDKQLPSVTALNASAKREAAYKKELMKSGVQFAKKRTQSQGQKRDKKDKSLSKSQVMIEQKMVLKNMNIRQKAVNETPPFVGFHSQNLFKLPHERCFRENVTFEDSKRIQKQHQEENPQNKKQFFVAQGANVALNLLHEDTDDESECEFKTDEQHEQDYLNFKAYNKNERDCKTVTELNQLRELRAQVDTQTQADQKAKGTEKALAIENKKNQKSCDLAKGLNLQNFQQIGDNLIAPANKLKDAMISFLRQTAIQAGNPSVVHDINRSFTAKQKSEQNTQLRPNTILRSKLPDVDNKRQNVDADKNYFLNEMMKLLAHAENYEKNQKYVALFNSGLTIAFLCITVKHYSLACKVYSLFGQILLVARKGDLATLMYHKLRTCAHTSKDLITKMFAYKQLGYTYGQLAQYESACLAFKHMLAIAWTVRSQDGEFSAYEGLAKMNLYLGQIQKCKFYDARLANGKYEPYDSQLFKISVSATLNEHEWLKDKGNRTQKQQKIKMGLEKAQSQADDLSKLGTHLVSFFTNSVRDYTLLRPDILKALKEVTDHFKDCHYEGQEVHDIMRDPSSQYLDNFRQIGSPKFVSSNISSVFGSKNEMQQKIMEDFQAFRQEQRKNLPSPSSHVDEKKPFTIDKLVPKKIDDPKERIIQQQQAKHQPKVCPKVALYNQIQKRKIDEEYRRLLIQQEKIKTKEQRALEAQKQSKLDLNDLRARARAHSRFAPSANVNITHLSRRSKNEKLYQKNRQFQLQYDFEGLVKEVYSEKDKVFVMPETFKLLNTATNEQQINQATKHTYVGSAKHLQRIKADKKQEKDRKKEIWKRLEDIELEKERLEQKLLNHFLESNKTKNKPSTMNLTQATK